MSDKKNRVMNITVNIIKSTPKGECVLESQISDFMRSYLDYSLKNDELETDLLGKWLMGELGFDSNEMTEILSGLRAEMKNQGIKILEPGIKADSADMSPPAPDDEPDLEWNGDNEEPDLPPPPRAAGVDSDVAVSFESPEREAAKEADQSVQAQRDYTGQPINLEMARELIVHYINGKASVEPLVDSVLGKKVLTSGFARELFQYPDSGMTDMKSVRDALALILALELDYMRYKGLRKTVGFDLNNALNETRSLLSQVKTIDKFIDQAEIDLVKSAKFDLLKEVKDIQERLKKIAGQIKDFVTDFEATAGDAPGAGATQVEKTPVKQKPPRRPRKPAKSSAGKTSSSDKAKIVMLTAFTLAVLIGVSLYLRSIFIQPPPLQFEAAEYHDILPLKEAIHSGNAFKGVIGKKDWDELTSDEKESKVLELSKRVSQSRIDGVILVDDKNHPLAMVSNGQTQIIK